MHLKRAVVLLILSVLPWNLRSALAQVSSQDAAARLGRSINLGNALEAPSEGAWGLELKADHLQAIALAGFQAVRVPIRWSAHAAKDAPYTIEPAFFERIDWVVRHAHRNQLAVVLNVHHYDELMSDPATQRERFLKIWEQIATRYQSESDEVYFELLNEPTNQLHAGAWNELLSATIQVIRQTNPKRPLIVGPADWNQAGALEQLQLPLDDAQLIVTFHYYQPFEFTHQGAEWVNGSSAWLGRTWNGSEEEKQAIRADLDRAVTWASIHQRPLFLGEFGCYSKADLASRARWTQFVATEAAQRKMATAYWEFAAGFGAYDRTTNKWIPELLDALAPHDIFDQNQDGRTTKADYVSLQEKIKKQDALEATDLNRDGVANEADLRFWTHYAGPDGGDFDQNGKWDARDIDALSKAVRERSSSVRFDVDHDGSITIQDRRHWVEVIMHTFFGDANLDGLFDNIDMVSIYAYKQYEDDKPQNSGWAQGDFDGDQEFTAADVTQAMQSGAFEKGPRKD
jgi:endoglucanase